MPNDLASPSVPDPAHVGASLACRGCEYDLARQPVAGVCPECGTAVMSSLSGLAAASAERLGTLDRALFRVVAVLLYGPVVVLACSVPVWFDPTSDDAMSTIGALLLPLGPIAAMPAWAKLATPLDPPVLPPRCPLASRLVTPLAAVFAAATTASALGFVAGEHWGMGVWRRPTELCMFAAVTAWCLRNAAGLAYASSLLRSSNGGGWVRRASALAALWAALAVGPVLVWYLERNGHWLGRLIMWIGPALMLSTVGAAIGQVVVLSVLRRRVRRYRKTAQRRAGPLLAPGPPPNPRTATTA